MHHSRLHTTLLVALLLTAAPLVRAADVLDNVPNDALGFAVIKHLDATNSKAEKLLDALQLQFPGPLALLKSATGIDSGLNRRGDLLLAILPGARPGDRPQLGIWLPVSDYKQFVTALTGTPTDGITAVTVADEDLLVAERGGWAVVMDPDQRNRLQNLLTVQAAPPSQIAPWKHWIDTNNVTAVLLPSGWHALWAWAATDSAEGVVAIGPPDDDLFGPPSAADGDDLPEAEAADDLLSQLREQIRAQLRELPQLVRWASESDAAACGVRIDDELNVVAGIRIAVEHDWPMPTPRDATANTEATPPTLFQSGDFIINGAARVPGPFAAAVAGAFAHSEVEELRNDIRVAMDDEVAARFQKAVEQATADVTAASILTRPGEDQDGTYSNSFFAVRVADATSFVGRVAEVMRLWNEMNKSEEDESQLVFETEAAQIGERAATVYSLDMVEAFGAAAIPEVRPSMERLFGPGGKLRLLVVPVDMHIVLLAAATAEQATPVIDVLAQGRPIAWHERTNRLLPREADWRLMVSPQGHTRWLKRQMEAMLGPVIGAPAVRQFPSSLPIGAAGGFTAHEIWADAAVPAETIRACGQYLHQR